MNASDARTAESVQPRTPSIRRGVCWVMLAYDAGLQIDLDAAEKVLASRATLAAAAGAAVSETMQREQLKPHRRSPEYFKYQPEPLRVTQACDVEAVGSRSVRGSVEITLFDFGAASVQYEIPLSGPLEKLTDLADALYENKALIEDSRRRLHALVDRLRGCVTRPQIAEMVETYAVYHIEEMDAEPSEVIAEHGPLLAQILRAERASLSRDEVADALSCVVSYTPRDATLVDWNAALVMGPEGADARDVLEFANVELLEVRHLDDRLDRDLDAAYKLIGSLRWHDLALAGPRRGALRRVAQMQIEGALLFESMNNTLKLMGDQYLARLSRVAAQRFHLPDWDQSVLRKLATLDGIYEKISDRQNVVRMEIIEWIVVLLIFVSIVLPFLGVGK